MRQRRGTRRDIGEPGDEIGQLVAPVEAVGELGEVAPHVFRIAGVIGSVDRPLDVAQQRVHPGQPGHFAAALTIQAVLQLTPS